MLFFGKGPLVGFHSGFGFSAPTFLAQQKPSRRRAFKHRAGLDGRIKKRGQPKKVSIYWATDAN